MGYGLAFSRDHLSCAMEKGLKGSMIRGREASEEGSCYTNLAGIARETINEWQGNGHTGRIEKSTHICHKSKAICSVFPSGSSS